MEEKNLRKKVIKYTVVLALISAVIIGCSAIVVVAVRKAEERSYTAYVDSLVNEYRLRFEERMASAFETLQLMGELMEDGLLSKESIVTDQIQNLSENSSFFKLSYYDIRSEEQLFQLPGSDLEYEFSNRPEEAQEAIRRAWEGETAVSQVYEQDGVQVITYVIPVYQENEVQGALAGVQELSQFYDIIGGETTSGDRINIFWTESDGTVLTTSAEESAAEYGAAMIEEADFGSDAEQDREKIARKTVRWDGEPYTLTVHRWGRMDGI